MCFLFCDILGKCLRTRFNTLMLSRLTN